MIPKVEYHIDQPMTSSQPRWLSRSEIFTFRHSVSPGITFALEDKAVQLTELGVIYVHIFIIIYIYISQTYKLYMYIIGHIHVYIHICNIYIIYIHIYIYNIHYIYTPYRVTITTKDDTHMYAK